MVSQDARVAARPAGARGLRVVTVVGPGVRPAGLRRLLAERLADEFPPEAIHVVSVVAADWLLAVALDPTVDNHPVCAALLEEQHARRRVELDALLTAVSEIGAPTTGSWTATSWRWTVWQARRAPAADLVLAFRADPGTQRPWLRSSVLGGTRRRRDCSTLR